MEQFPGAHQPENDPKEKQQVGRKDWDSSLDEQHDEVSEMLREESRDLLGDQDQQPNAEAPESRPQDHSTTPPRHEHPDDPH